MRGTSVHLFFFLKQELSHACESFTVSTVRLTLRGSNPLLSEMPRPWTPLTRAINQSLQLILILVLFNVDFVKFFIMQAIIKCTGLIE